MSCQALTEEKLDDIMAQLKHLPQLLLKHPA
jgi:hypothetical protein